MGIRWGFPECQQSPWGLCRCTPNLWHGVVSAFHFISITSNYQPSMVTQFPSQPRSPIQPESLTPPPLHTCPTQHVYFTHFSCTPLAVISATLNQALSLTSPRQPSLACPASMALHPLCIQQLLQSPQKSWKAIGSLYSLSLHSYPT